MADKKKKTILMLVSVAGEPSFAARSQYTVSTALADELIAAGYAEEAKADGRRGRPRGSEKVGPDEDQDDDLDESDDLDDSADANGAESSGKQDESADATGAESSGKQD